MMIQSSGIAYPMSQAKTPETHSLDDRSLFPPLRLDFDEDVNQGHSRRRHSWDARGLSQCARLHVGELFLHLVREPADGAVVEPSRDASLFRLLHPLHGALLLQQVAFILDLGLHRLEFIADFGRKRSHGFSRIFSGEEFRTQFAENGRELFDNHLWAL